jgi:hypothetical protein
MPVPHMTVINRRRRVSHAANCPISEFSVSEPVDSDEGYRRQGKDFSAISEGRNTSQLDCKHVKFEAQLNGFDGPKIWESRNANLLISSMKTKAVLPGNHLQQDAVCVEN